MPIRDSRTCLHKKVINRSVLCVLLPPGRVQACGDLACSVAHAIVPAGEATLPHRLRTVHELYYVLSGTGRMHIGGQSRTIRAGQVVQVPPKAIRFIENCGPSDLVVLCIVTPPWRADDGELVTDTDDW